MVKIKQVLKLIFHFYSDPNDVVASGFGSGRSFSTEDDISNILKRTIVDDQIDVLGVSNFFLGSSTNHSLD